MKKFSKFVAFSIPFIILAVLVCISLGSFTSRDTITQSILDYPGNAISGFGFWEGKLHLIAMLFPLLLMLIASFEKNNVKAN